MSSYPSNSETMNLLGEKLLVYYDVLAILGLILLILVLVYGGLNMRKRAEKREFPWLGKYESLVAFGMFFGALILSCSLCLVLIAMISN